MIYDLLDLLDLLEEFFLKIINSGYHFEIKKDKDGKYIESCKTDGNTESCGYEISEKTGKFKKKKRFGKSLSNRAPALLIEIINRKLEYIGKNIIKIDTFKVKASQLNHSTNEYEKKSLSKRWVEILGNKIQRDLYSAFLIKNVKENLEEVNIEKAQKEFKNFVKLHNEEIERIKKGNVKTLKCMGF
jgi:hypothetical protein